MSLLRKDQKTIDQLKAPEPEHPLLSGAQAVGVISGENPAFAAQESGHEALGRHLKSLGLTATEHKGRYGQPERSWVVLNPSREQMFHLGQRFGQESVIFSPAGGPGKQELLRTNGAKAGRYHPATGHETFEQEPEDYYTEMAPNKYLRLSFDWDTAHPAPLGPDTAALALQARAAAPQAQTQKSEAFITKDQLRKALAQSLRKALAKAASLVVPHPHAYPWHNEHTSHHFQVAAPGAILRGGNLIKADGDIADLKSPPEYREVKPDEFESVISKHPNQSALDQDRDYAGKRTFLAHDNQSGYALHESGDLCHVFSFRPGHGAHAVRHAIANGATTLNAFEGKLPEYYARFGFKESGREKNWTPGGPDVVFMSLGKAEGDQPASGTDHLQAPPKNDQAAGVGVSTYAKFAVPYGTIDKTRASDLTHYPYHGKNAAVDQLVKDHGYSTYYAGGKYGRPDLANRNFNTKHLMIYDPTPESGGDFGHEQYTDAWRKIHELAHALTYPEVNKIYGEGRRIGKLGHHRTMREAARAVHWEHLAAHKQRELSKAIGVEIPDHVFNKEYSTVMHDAAHRAVTGLFTEPSQEGFHPHSHHVPLETALSLVREHAHTLGLKGDHDLIQKPTRIAKSEYSLEEARGIILEHIDITMRKYGLK
jgi:hypothetical protein